MMKHLLSLCLIVLLLPAFAWADAAGESSLSVRSFQLRHKPAESAAAVIRQLVSAEGSLGIQPSSNTLTVTDRPENLRRIAAAMEKFDLPAQSFRVQLRLVSAGRAAAPGKVPEELREVAAKLSGVLRFNSFESVGDLAVSAKEGDPVVVRLDSGYRAEMKFGEYDPITESIRLHDFKLSRVQPSGADSGQVVPLFNATLNLKIGNTVVVGAQKQPDSQRALMLVLVAEKP